MNEEPDFDIKKDIILCKLDYCIEILNHGNLKDAYNKLSKTLLEIEQDVKEY